MEARIVRNEGVYKFQVLEELHDLRKRRPTTGSDLDVFLDETIKILEQPALLNTSEKMDHAVARAMRCIFDFDILEKVRTPEKIHEITLFQS